MTDSIRKTTNEEDKRVLRKVKTLPSAVKAAVYRGALKDKPALCSQFNTDIRVYGLWEALLYVENYEEEGVYAEGTAANGVAAALNKEAKE